MKRRYGSLSNECLRNLPALSSTSGLRRGTTPSVWPGVFNARESWLSTPIRALARDVSV
jgi:hypothetical protein